MILTCPDCASRYVVDDARIGPNGRTVRCASCGVAWRAERETVEAPQPLDLSQTVAPEPPEDRPAPLPKRLRAEAQEKLKSRQAVAAGVAWAALGAGFVAVMLGAVLFRVDVVRLWPQTASAYAFAKMPVNPTGLALETVQGQPNLIGGHAALSITGVERNVETGVRLSMPLRVVLYDKAGKRLISAVAAPPVRPIAPGDTRPFAVNFIDPPVDGSSFVVEFAFDKVGPAGKTPASSAPGVHAQVGPAKPLQTAVAAPPPAPVLHAKEAMSVPADSPYALPAAAGPQATH
jgi:predicted Zn finger-like uncharacterized protein